MIEDLVEVEIDPGFNAKVISETLVRIGVSNKKEKCLYPSVYLYRDDETGKHYLAHFKEIFALRKSGYDDMSDEDILRRNSIIYCLVNWGMVTVLDEEKIIPHNKFVFVLPYKEKSTWKIVHKIKYFIKD